MLRIEWSGEITCQVLKNSSAPNGRCSHAAVVLGYKGLTENREGFDEMMLIFGGSDATTLYEDLHALRLGFSPNGRIHDAATPVGTRKRPAQFAWESLDLINPSQEILGRAYLTMHAIEDINGGVVAYIFGNADGVAGSNEEVLLRVDRLSLVGSGNQWHIDTDISNPSSNGWLSVESRLPAAPSARNAHCSSLVAADLVYLFGGKISNRKTSTSKPQYLGDLWSFDPAGESWACVSTVGTPPSPRAYAAMTVADDGNKLFLFAGYDGRSQLNDIYCLNVKTSSWNQLMASGQLPMPRMNCTLTAAGPYLVVFGGRRKSTRSNDVYLLDTRTNQWQVLHEEGGRSATTLQDDKENHIPSVRTAHSAVCVCPKQKAPELVGHIIFFGGYQGNGKWLNDVHILSLWHESNKAPQRNLSPDTQTGSDSDLERPSDSLPRTHHRPAWGQQKQNCLNATTEQDFNGTLRNISMGHAKETNLKNGWKKRAATPMTKRKSVAETPLKDRETHSNKRTRTSGPMTPFTEGSSVKFNLNGASLNKSTRSMEQQQVPAAVAENKASSSTEDLKLLLVGLESRLIERLRQEVEVLADRETALGVLAANVDQTKTILSTELGQVSSSIAEVNQKLSEMSSEVPSLRSETRHISSKLSSVGEQIISLEPAIREQSVHIKDHLKTERELFSEEMLHISKLIDEFKSRAEKAESMIKSKNECIDQAEARALKAENELENLKTEIANQQKVHDTLKAIHSEIQTSSEGHHKLADKIDELMQNKESDELAILQGANSDLKAELSSSKLKNEQLAHNIVELRSEISELLQNNNKVAEELSQQQLIKQDLLQKYEGTKKELEDLSEEYARLKGKVEMFVRGFTQC